MKIDIMIGRKIIIPVIIVLVITGIAGFELKDWNRKIKYVIEILPADGDSIQFNTSIRLSGETIKLNNQKAPYKTEITANNLEFLIDAEDNIKIVILSEHGKIEGEFRTAYIQAGHGKSRIFGI
jgi:hypothetical protein